MANNSNKKTIRGNLVENNIIDTIKNNDSILELFNRAIFINKKIINLNIENEFKVSVIGTIIFIINFIICSIFSISILNDLQETTFFNLFIAILLPLLTYIIPVFSVIFFHIIISLIKSVMILINYKNKIIRNFEKSLNYKDLELYKNYNFHKRDGSFYDKNDFQYLLYDIYMDNFKNLDIETLHKNKNLIIDNIKTKFNVENQKKLLNVIADILDKNNIDKEMERINTSFEKLELKKFNNINVENI